MTPAERARLCAEELAEAVAQSPFGDPAAIIERHIEDAVAGERRDLALAREHVARLAQELAELRGENLTSVPSSTPPGSAPLRSRG